MLFFKQIILFAIQIDDSKTEKVCLTFSKFCFIYPLKIVGQFVDEGAENRIIISDRIVF